MLEADKKTSKTEDSINRRYLAKLSTNILGLFIGFGTQAIIPRGLGPAAYGNFYFLFNSFKQIYSFIDMGSSFGFFSKLSQRKQDTGLIAFYGFFSISVCLLVSVFIVLIHLINKFSYIFPGQSIFFIYIGMIFGFLNWGSETVQKMIDAYGLTVKGETLKILMRIINIVIVGILFFFSRLNLFNFFLSQYFGLFLLIACLLFIAWKEGFLTGITLRLSRSQIKQYFSEFYKYTNPLFIYACVGLIAPLSERWLLQYFGGSVEQGFFWLSFQIGLICSLFTSAMDPLFLREFAIAFSKNDNKEMQRIYNRYVPMLYAISAYFSCFIAFQTSKVIFLFGGEKFSGAFWAIFIMAFLPLHHTYGQACGQYFYGTGETRVYRNIGIIFMLSGMFASFFILTPVKYFGLNAGATGLALKTVVFNVFYANILNYVLCKKLKVRFWSSIKHQVICVAVMATLSLMTRSMDIILKSLNIFMLFIIDGIIYSIMVVIFILVFPQLFGLEKNDIYTLKNIILKKINAAYQ